jgi:hypothetical protein
LALPIDQARLRPHLRAHGQLERQQADVFRQQFERAGQAEVDTTAPRARGNERIMADVVELRGLPVLAPGVRGESPGSNPVAELLRKERRRTRAR